jgi:ABC-2 type transport system ATP-binding protein
MIRLTEITKEYGGGPWARGRVVRALAGVSLEVAPGTALGVIGLNGAGKSTLLRLLLGYVRPTAGEASIRDLPPREYAERHGIAYVPERVAIPGQWTVRGALMAYAMLGDLEDAPDRVDAALRRLGMEELADRKVGRLSKGNLQRLAIAQALLGDRELMVLDEPTDGLDPVWIAELRRIVADWRAADPTRTLIVASHNLPEVERIADRVVVLHEGRVREALELGSGAHPGLEEFFLRTVGAGTGGAA